MMVSVGDVRCRQMTTDEPQLIAILPLTMGALSGTVNLFPQILFEAVASVACVMRCCPMMLTPVLIIPGFVLTALAHVEDDQSSNVAVVGKSFIAVIFTHTVHIVSLLSPLGGKAGNVVFHPRLPVVSHP
nr:hypothetical protein BaRGS_011068 [Batillaria attramentaria]